jgi:DNA-binding NtrC family response regulator
MTDEALIHINTTVLVVDDEDAEWRAQCLRPFCREVLTARTAGAAQNRIRAAKAPLLVLLDLYLVKRENEGNPEPTFGLIRWIRQQGLRASGRVAVVMMSAYATDRQKLELYKQGFGVVWDKVNMSVNDLRLFLLLLEADMEERQAFAASARLPEGVVGKSPGLLKAYETARRLAPRDEPVVIVGETGTGKEALAKFLHDCSRPGKPFVPVNCGSLGGDLNMQLGELFGHVKGAFAHAIKDRKGAFTEARDGSVFLDNLHHLHPETQHALLRAVEQRRYRPVGGEEKDARTCAARFLIAVSEEPEALVKAGRLSAELRFRLEKYRIDLAPLRERGEDVLLAADRICRDFWGMSQFAGQDTSATTLSDGARAFLLQQEYRSGNFRELDTLVHAACVKAEDRGEYVITAEDFGVAAPAGGHVPGESLREQYERMGLEEAERRAGGNMTKAARLFGLSRAQFYRLRSAYRDRPAEQ